MFYMLTGGGPAAACFLCGGAVLLFGEFKRCDSSASSVVFSL